MVPAKDTGQDRSSHSHFDYQERFQKSIHSPFPEEWTPALPYLQEAYRLEAEGARQHEVDEMIEKARQEDSLATSYYMTRWEIIKKNRPKRVKISPDEKT
jgi:hypothetical protein